MNKLLRTIAAAMAFVLVAAACGDDDDTGAVADGGPIADGGGQDDGEGADDLSGQSIDVVAVWSGDEADNFEQVIQAFEAETGVEVNYRSTGDDIAAVLGTAIEGGQPPDVAILPQPGLLQDLAEAGDLIPIEDFAGGVVDENYAPVWRELGTVDGELYGVWFKASNKSLIWYSLAAFEDAGVEPPEDWEGLLETSQTLLDSGVTPMSVGGADGWTLTDWFENVYLRTAGPETYDKLVDHEIPWTDESVITALNTMEEMIGQPDFVANGLDGALQVDFPTSVTQVFGADREAAMVFEGDFVAGVITGETDAEIGTDADFFEFPSIDGSPPSVVGSGDVAVMLQDNEAARAFISFLASAEAGEVWAELGGFSSPNQNVDVDVYPDEVSRRAAEQIAQAEVFRFDLSDLQPAEFGGTPGQGLFRLFQEWLAAPQQAEQIAQQMEDAASAAF
jgi:alpha-glucoside transport system substrate-binding protein